MAKALITLLGTGTSQGVPVIACKCSVCQSLDPKNKRLRCSVMLSVNGENYVIDSGPDFRQQMLRAGVNRLDALLFTHGHKDHIAGTDDVRAFNYLQKKPMPIYGSVFPHQEISLISVGEHTLLLLKQLKVLWQMPKSRLLRKQKNSLLQLIG